MPPGLSSVKNFAESPAKTPGRACQTDAATTPRCSRPPVCAVIPRLGRSAGRSRPPSTQVRSITKDDKSPVTVADFASQAIVALVLTREAGPGDARRRGGERLPPRGRAQAPPRRDARRRRARRLGRPTENSTARRDRRRRRATREPRVASGPSTPSTAPRASCATSSTPSRSRTSSRGAPTPRRHGLPQPARATCLEPLDTSPTPTAASTWPSAARASTRRRATTQRPSPIRITRLDHAEGEPICVCASVEKAHSNVRHTDRDPRVLRDDHGEEVGEPVRLDSQCKYAVVARGQADAYLRLPTKQGLRRAHLGPRRRRAHRQRGGAR
jgi:hypothetical protein